MSKKAVLFRTKPSENSLSLGKFDKTREIYLGKKKKDKGKEGKKKLCTLFAITS